MVESFEDEISDTEELRNTQKEQKTSREKTVHAGGGVISDIGQTIRRKSGSEQGGG